MTRMRAPPRPPLLLIVAANARSLVANRGDLIEAAKHEGWRVVALVPEVDYLDAVDGLGIEIRRIRLARASLNPLEDLRSALEIARHVRRERPAVVFGYSAKPVIYGALGTALAGLGSGRQARFGAMITGMGYAFSTDSLRSRLVQGVMVLLYRAAIARSAVVFVQNPDDEALLRARGILRADTRVVRVAGSGIHLERFGFLPPVVEPVTFTMIGRMLEDKGIREFIGAARRVKAAHAGARFVLIAPFDPSLPRSVPREEAEAAAAEGTLTYVPGTPDVRPYLAETSVYVLPSYREGTPRSVLEAMAMGRAVITSDAPGCRETVEEGRNGFLVPIKDEAALAAAMKRFLAAPELVGRMGAEGRRMAEQRFDVRTVNRTILAALGIDAATGPKTAEA
jgi:glycosyltransferase involved in cell wall biosynthesis